MFINGDGLCGTEGGWMERKKQRQPWEKKIQKLKSCWLFAVHPKPYHYAFSTCTTPFERPKVAVRRRRGRKSGKGHATHA